MCLNTGMQVNLDKKYLTHVRHFSHVKYPTQVRYPTSYKQTLRVYWF